MKPDPILDQDILIGQYTLGVLTPQEMHRIEALLGRDPAAARTALRWEEALLSLVDALPPTQPAESVLKDVLSALDLPLPPEGGETANLAPPPKSVSFEPEHLKAAQRHRPATSNAPLVGSVVPRRANTSKQNHVTTDQSPRSDREQAGHTTGHTPTNEEPTNVGLTVPQSTLSHERKRRTRHIWAGSATAVVVMALLTLAFMPRQPAEPPVVVVEVAPTKGAILQAPGQSSTPGWVVTIDLENNVTLTPKVHTETPDSTSVQLWTYNKASPRPRSLGLIDPNLPVAIPGDLIGDIGEDQFFEMTLEPSGGSPTNEPNGPILYIGRVVTFS